MKRKRILGLALAAVMALGLAACSSSSSSGESSGGDATGDLPTVGVLIYKYDDTYISTVRNAIETALDGKAEIIMQDVYKRQAVSWAAENNVQVISHCNGDMACDQFIDAVGRCKNKRAVIIHAQLLRKDQLDKVKEYEMIPSFFVAHTFHWGDTHIKNFGLERAKTISPANSALKKGILFTFHQDAPVIEQDMFETVWCAAKRQTKDGVILGEDERISVLQALKAVTVNAAYQYFEMCIRDSLL